MFHNVSYNSYCSCLSLLIHTFTDVYSYFSRIVHYLITISIDFRFIIIISVRRVQWFHGVAVPIQQILTFEWISSANLLIPSKTISVVEGHLTLRTFYKINFLWKWMWLKIYLIKVANLISSIVKLKGKKLFFGRWKSKF